MNHALLPILLFVLPAAVHADEPINIGSRRELFVDRYLIEILDAARLVLHRPQPRGLAMRFDKPWETRSPGYVAVIHDDDVYRMYYRATHTPPNYVKKRTTPRREVTCYAESKDGIRWTRPELGFVEFNGSKNNNIMWDGVGTHNFTPFKDTNPDCARDARYRAFGRGRPLAKEPSPYEHGLYAFKSSDAIHWQAIGDGRIDKAETGPCRRISLCEIPLRYGGTELFQSDNKSNSRDWCEKFSPIHGDLSALVASSRQLL
jgi:hypothetical protein